MLVLSRKLNEQIVIGENIVLTVVRLRSGAVAIGIDAPEDVRVRRGELAPRAGTELVAAPSIAREITLAPAESAAEGPNRQPISEAVCDIPPVLLGAHSVRSANGRRGWEGVHRAEARRVCLSR